MNSRQGTGLIHAQRPRPNAWGAPQPTVTPQELNRNDSTTILQTAETTTNKPTENHNPRRFICHKSHTYVENQSRKLQWHGHNTGLPGPMPAWIGHFSHDGPEIRVNTGLAGRHSRNPRKQWASGQVARKRPIYADLRQAVKNAHQPIRGPSVHCDGLTPIYCAVCLTNPGIPEHRCIENACFGAPPSALEREWFCPIPWGVEHHHERAVQPFDQSRQKFNHRASIERVMLERIVLRNLKVSDSISHVVFPGTMSHQPISGSGTVDRKDRRFTQGLQE